jgi:hypothetical protein
MNGRLILFGLAAFAALYAMPGTTHGQIFVSNYGTNPFGNSTIGKYTT